MSDMDKDARGGGGARRSKRDDRRQEGRAARTFFRRRRVCKFCVEKIDYISYKDVKLLAPFIPGARQDSAAPHLRRVRDASARAADGHQARAADRARAVYD